MVGLSVGWGPGPVGFNVGFAVVHSGVLIPKHAPTEHPVPEGQGSAVMQFASASW